MSRKEIYTQTINQWLPEVRVRTRNDCKMGVRSILGAVEMFQDHTAKGTQLFKFTKNN